MTPFDTSWFEGLRLGYWQQACLAALLGDDGDGLKTSVVALVYATVGYARRVRFLCLGNCKGDAPGHAA